MHIDNSKKAWTTSTSIVGNGNLNNIECTLLITTEQASSGSGWYSKKITMPIDRSDKGKIYEYETFFY
jgi:hypothetical protein